MYSHSFLQKQTRLHRPTIVRDPLRSADIPATHPYYDTFVNMSKMYEEVPENTKSKLTHRPTGRVLQIKVFERIDIPSKGDCIVQISESLSSIHP
jgi:hypothetical protein